MTAPLPPHDIATETALVMSIVADPRLRDRVTLDPSEFYSAAMRAVVMAILAIEEAGETIDLVNVGSHIARMGRLADVDGLAGLSALLGDTPAVDAVEDYAARVSDYAKRRAFIELARRLSAEAHKIAPGFFDSVESRIMALTSGTGTVEDTCATVGQAALAIFTAIKDQTPVRRIPSQIKTLDRIIGGWTDGELVVVAGRPGMGKSAFGCGAAVNVAFSSTAATYDSNGVQTNTGEAYASLIMSAEMTRHEIAERILAAEAHVACDRIQSHQVHQGDWEKLTQAMQGLHTVPCWIDERPAPTLTDVRSKIRMVKAELARMDRNPKTRRPDGMPRRLALVVIDHLQIVGTNKGKDTTRAREIGEYTAGLKQIAKREKLCVMALSQLNREVEKRADKRPLLSDLRETGDIEQDADRVICLYRDDYYNKQSRMKGCAEAIVRKARGGRTGTAFVAWNGAYTQFSELTESELHQLRQEDNE
jgi:replicative DNA helicase